MEAVLAVGSRSSRSLRLKMHEQILQLDPEPEPSLGPEAVMRASQAWRARREMRCEKVVVRQIDLWQSSTFSVGGIGTLTLG